MAGKPDRSFRPHQPPGSLPPGAGRRTSARHRDGPRHRSRSTAVLPSASRHSTSRYRRLPRLSTLTACRAGSGSPRLLQNRAKSISLSACDPPATSATTRLIRRSRFTLPTVARVSVRRSGVVSRCWTTAAMTPQADRSERRPGADIDGGTLRRVRPAPPPHHDVGLAGVDVTRGPSTAPSPDGMSSGAMPRRTMTCVVSRSQPRRPATSSPVQAHQAAPGPQCKTAAVRRARSVIGPRCSTTTVGPI